MNASMVDARFITRASCPRFLDILFHHPGNRQAALFFSSRKASERLVKSAKL
jgi:hypothetical protein